MRRKTYIIYSQGTCKDSRGDEDRLFQQIFTHLLFCIFYQRCNGVPVKFVKVMCIANTRFLLFEECWLDQHLVLHLCHDQVGEAVYASLHMSVIICLDQTQDAVLSCPMEFRHLLGTLDACEKLTLPFN